MQTITLTFGGEKQGDLYITKHFGYSIALFQKVSDTKYHAHCCSSALRIVLGGTYTLCEGPKLDASRFPKCHGCYLSNMTLFVNE